MNDISLAFQLMGYGLASVFGALLLLYAMIVLLGRFLKDKPNPEGEGN